MPNAFTRSSPLARNDKFSSAVGALGPSARVIWPVARVAQLTSFLAVASCGLLPRTTRPGPRVRTAFWSVAILPLRDTASPGPGRPSHGVQCHPERSEPASEVEGSATQALD